MEEKGRSCIDCRSGGCDGTGGRRPPFCLTDSMPEGLVERSRERYEGTVEGELLRTAATVERDGYRVWCRVQETMEFARRMGYRRIGIATCVGLLSESGALASILRANGFEVYGISCKAGMVGKVDVGIDPVCCEVGPNTCNPLLQADILNSAGTDLNIVMGLCVGHDSLFYRSSEAPVTTLVVKDRVLAHNPVGALYTSSSYYRDLKEGGVSGRSRDVDD